MLIGRCQVIPRDERKGNKPEEDRVNTPLKKSSNEWVLPYINNSRRQQVTVTNWVVWSLEADDKTEEKF